MTLTDETMRRVAEALERLVALMEHQADGRAEPTLVEPPARVIPKGGRRAA